MRALERYRRDIAAKPNFEIERVMAIAQQYTESGLSQEELIAEGNVGLAEALDLLKAGRLERPFASEVDIRVRLHMENAIKRHEESATLHDTLQYDSPLVDQFTEGSHHGELFEQVDEAREIWRRLIKGHNEQSHRKYMLFYHYFGIGLPFPQTLETFSEVLEMNQASVKMLLTKAIDPIFDKVFWFRNRHSPQAIMLLVDKYYHDSAIFETESPIQDAVPYCIPKLVSNQRTARNRRVKRQRPNSVIHRVFRYVRAIFR